MVNSIYSFYWDVAVDWKLSLLQLYTPPAPLPASSSDNDEPSSLLNGAGDSYSGSSSGGETIHSPNSIHERLLRPHLYFKDPVVYYLAVVMDLCLRFIWSLKISTHLVMHQFTLGGFILETLEILRRWIWVFFRLEREWVGRGYGRLGPLKRRQHQEIQQVVAGVDEAGAALGEYVIIERDNTGDVSPGGGGGGD